MSGPGSGRLRWEERALHAYHDGELRGLALWRFERRLGKKPGLGRELAALGRIREAAREIDDRQPGPELWERIALRLPALDARRAEAATKPRRRATLLMPLGAAVCATGVAIGVALWLPTGDTETGGAMRWMDGGDRDVMVLRDDAEATIIWLLDSGSPGAARGGSGAVL